MRDRLRMGWLVTAVAVVLACVEAAGIVSRTALSGHPLSWLRALGTGLGLWLSMAAVAPIPIWMAARFPFERGAVARRLPLHVLAAVAFVTLHLTLDIGAQTLQGNMRPEPFGRHLLYLLGEYLGIEMVVYAAIAGACMFWRARREAEWRELAAETIRAELGEARLAALQSQIAPHFLFNTLNAISTLAMKGDRDAVTRAIATLAELLRSVLANEHGHEVELTQELAFLDRYLELQQLRFPDRLTIERRIGSDVRHALVPRLLLQPIVENAVRHGLEATGSGVVTLSARREAGTLVLEVDDQPHEPAALSLQRESSSGIGLANARARLASLYGIEQSLELIGRDTGTTVRIRLPFRIALPGEAV